jgi:hypothetical protein
MREVTVTLPVISLIAVTRGMLGAGLALLLGERLNGKQRKATGWTLVLVGAATTVPLALEVMGRRRQGRDQGLAVGRSNRRKPAFFSRG